MKIEQNIWYPSSGWKNIPELGERADLVLAFANRQILESKSWYAELRSYYRNADIIFCSTAGDIIDDSVMDDVLTTTAIHFERTVIKCRQIEIGNHSSHFTAGKDLRRLFPSLGLKHVFLISHGLNVNGTDLMKGMMMEMEGDIRVTGGLAGDGPDFIKTLVGLNEEPKENAVVAVGFYGDALKVGYGSMGGWDTFGHDRLVTRSEGNVLYELDRQPALDLYKTYLGDKAKDLPASGLLFPLSIKSMEDEKKDLVRTILSVDEETKSLTFAGDVPEGATVRLMKANFERLYDGASTAAESSIKILDSTAELAVLISCVGRKLILKSRTEDEVECVRDVIGDTPKITGFYSYGELGPGFDGTSCHLHNQTMTITLFSEN